ncbi:hypothetical protein PYCCODRAFT_1153004 [Trametes coccinea BRFM310]|uniref:Uncharacterized protein n=1 Tax=Trametes coccinea (strain BRFM310) TaxID=1353009 RepID=A0A1Y2IWM4_TRAC3|nr:hypothetical protein PYCCODRAFT_1153004 [Trametes coccinea BRFM310]
MHALALRGSVLQTAGTWSTRREPGSGQRRKNSALDATQRGYSLRPPARSPRRSSQSWNRHERRFERWCGGETFPRGIRRDPSTPGSGPTAYSIGTACHTRDARTPRSGQARGRSSWHAIVRHAHGVLGQRACVWHGQQQQQQQQQHRRSRSPRHRSVEESTRGAGVRASEQAPLGGVPAVDGKRVASRCPGMPCPEPTRTHASMRSTELLMC